MGSDLAKFKSYIALKNLFNDLKYNFGRSFITPIDFINNFFEDKIDINVQKDVSQFYLSLLDQLDSFIINLKRTFFKIFFSIYLIL